MHTILLHIRQHFDGMTQKLDAFAEHAVQVESWFKGECLALAMILQKLDIITGFAREVRLPTGSRVDLRLDRPGASHWIELKHWLVGRQKDTTYSCKGYLGDLDLGCRADVAKLKSIPAITAEPVATTNQIWLWLFMTRNPGQPDWEAGIARFNERFNTGDTRLKIHPITSADHFPDSWFLGLAEVIRPTPP
jgi:hypothetical protein